MFIILEQGLKFSSFKKLFKKNTLTLMKKINREKNSVFRKHFIICPYIFYFFLQGMIIYGTLIILEGMNASVC